MARKQKSRIYTPEDMEIIEFLAQHEARESFWKYRQYINKGKLKIGWWQREIASILEQFFAEYKAGLRPIYIIEAPPQHGKSTQVVDFISDYSGKDPDIKTIYTSFSKSLGVRANRQLQRTIDTPLYRKIYQETMLGGSEFITSNNQPLRNQDILQFAGRDGFFRNTTVMGSITGESMDIGIVDDPLKGRVAANSPTVRENTWNWFTNDFLTRLADDGALLFILTRWHIDDPVGRYIAQLGSDRIKVFKYPAIALHDEKHRKAGEPLFPEHKSLEFLLQMQQTMSASDFQALYQQSPTVQDGEIVHLKWWEYYDDMPKTFSRVFQTWDFTRGVDRKNPNKRDYVAGGVWGVTKILGKKRLLLLDLERKKMSFPEMVEAFLKMCAKWPQAREKFFENAANAEAIRDLVENKIQDIILDNTHLTDGDKVARLEAQTPFIRGGHVMLPHPKHFLDMAPRVQAFLNEHSEFPNGTHDDQVDITSLACSKVFKTIDIGGDDIDAMRKKIKAMYG